MRKGKYSAFRVFQLVLDVAVLACMIGLMVSGIMLSRHVFRFLQIKGGISFARTLHMLASTDPVAVDQASIDLVYAAEGNAALVRRIESRNGLHTLEAAEQIGLGSRA